ncbi:MAG: DUF2027 domain-containing protein [Porphyromonas sp.]|nr:DUF2027 domain-containing protein [Porphyromonas sp.]
MKVDYKIGDRVKFLNTTGGGVIKKVMQSGDVLYVEDETGFEIPVLSNEVIRVEGEAAPDRSPMSKPKESRHSAFVAPVSSGVQSSDKAHASSSVPHEVIKRMSDPEGERLNVSLCYLLEADGIIGQSPYEVYLVNDTNYDLFVTYAIGDKRSKRLLFAGTVPFDSSERVDVFAPSELSERSRTTVQILAYKDDPEVTYEIKLPVSVELKVDGARFFKENAFVPTPYFDDNAILFELVKNDQPLLTQKVDAEKLAAEMMSRKMSDDRPKRQPTQRKTDLMEPLVVDLHIDELVDTTLGMEPKDMLDLQLGKVEEVLRAHRKPSYKGKKIVFIHGKGEGVLRKAVLDVIHKKYPKYDTQDASFQEYGFGATQVTIR